MQHQFSKLKAVQQQLYVVSTYFFYMTCILSILYHNLNALGPLKAEYSGINCLNISLGDWNL